MLMLAIPIKQFVIMGSVFLILRFVVQKIANLTLQPYVVNRFVNMARTLTAHAWMLVSSNSPLAIR
ncbi:hypothetical protein CGH44_23415 [Vibrio parahaemolyticus]|nr:hypothetical protein CGH44_23415 [Vibrio parahaemolyticus]